MFTSKKHIDRLHDSITELHTDKEHLQRIIHKQSDTILGLTVGIRQQAKIIQELSEENRKLRKEPYAEVYRDPLQCNSARIVDSISATANWHKDMPKSKLPRDEKGRFTKHQQHKR